MRQRGFAIVEGFLSDCELEAARESLWRLHPRPEEYFADPEAYPRLSRHQFAGLRLFPYGAWALDRLAFHPDLVDAAERLLGSADLDLYKVELWAKYAGAIDYDQCHHRDFGNHFSGKARPAFRIKRLLMEERLPTPDAYREMRERTGYIFLPTVVTPEGETWQDTSDILDRLEARAPEHHRWSFPERAVGERRRAAEQERVLGEMCLEGGRELARVRLEVRNRLRLHARSRREASPDGVGGAWAAAGRGLPPDHAPGRTRCTIQSA